MNEALPTYSLEFGLLPYNVRGSRRLQFGFLRHSIHGRSLKFSPLRHCVHVSRRNLFKMSHIDWLANPTICNRRTIAFAQHCDHGISRCKSLFSMQQCNSNDILSVQASNPSRLGCDSVISESNLSHLGRSFIIGALVLKIYRFLQLGDIMKSVLKLLAGCFNQQRVQHDDHVVSNSSTDLCANICKAFGKVVLSVLLFVCVLVQPFVYQAAPAYAANSADVNLRSESFYETLFKKFQQKDQELGRGTDEISGLQEKIQKLYEKVKAQKERVETVRQESNASSFSSSEERLLAALDRKFGEYKETSGGKVHLTPYLPSHKSSAKVISFSPYEERVFAILDSIFDEYKDRSQVKVNPYLSSYEEKLRQAFDAKFASLKKVDTDAADNSTSAQKMRELIEHLKVEERRFRSRTLISMQKSLAELKLKETQLKGRLKKTLARHINLQEKIDSDTKLSQNDLENLNQEIREVWEELLKLTTERQVVEEVSFQSALGKVPSLAEKLEESIQVLSKDQSSSSSPEEIQKTVLQKTVANDLTDALDNYLEHKYLPRAVDGQSSIPQTDEQTITYVDYIKRKNEESRDMLAKLEKMIQEDIKAESNIIGNPNEQGNLVIAPSLQKMKEEKKEELKQFLRENPEIGYQYIADKKDRVLKYRDRVLADSWYNEKDKRWEMSPKALKYAVEKDLVEGARIRQDRRVMYFTLKGDSRNFYADLQVFDDAYLNTGGFDALHLKMLGSGIPVSVEFMRIPLSQLDPLRVFSLPFRLLFSFMFDFLGAASKNPLVIAYFQSVVETFEEILGRVVFPTLDKLPRLIQVSIGLQLSDKAPPRSDPPFLMESKKMIQKRMEERYGQGESSTAWWISVPLKCFVLWIPYVYVSRFIAKVIGQIFGPDEEINEVEWKQKKGKEIMKKLKADNPKAFDDPVRQAFDNMKRIKNPEFRLKDFAGLDMVKAEINEIITFLRDPAIFKEMGARPPRGVLIVGRPGTGKTSLALAIAAEARVPLVDIDPLDLEGGAWVGQGASNVRELFKTARELAPLIIFMDDFDYFAGIRGDSGDTRKQDHEALINQLLVELDGFETQEGVVLIATSSRPGTIDEALRRPGRMDRTITLPMPNKTERELILRKAAAETMDHDLVELVDWKEIARKTEGMTPQQLKYVPTGLESSFASWKYTDDEELFTIFKWLVRFNKITPLWLAKSKLMRNFKSGVRDWLGLKITKEDVEAAVACIDVFNESCPGIEYRSPGYIWTREFKFPHAVWAAGRGLIGALLPNFDIVENIWLDRSSWEGIGFTRFTKNREGGYEETGTLTRSYYEKKLVLCFGSSVAARLMLPFGKRNDLSKFEIKEAMKIASTMVLEYGWGPDNRPTVYASPGEHLTLSMGDELEEELEEQAVAIYNAAARKAADMIEKNQGVLEALVEHLLTFEAISKKDLSRLMKEHGAICEEEPFMVIPYEEETTQTNQRNDLVVTVN